MGLSRGGSDLNKGPERREPKECSENGAVGRESDRINMLEPECGELSF